MRRQLNFLVISMLSVMTFSCKDEPKEELIGNEPLEIATKAPTLTRVERKITQEEMEETNSVMYRLVSTPEVKEFTSYVITANMVDNLSNGKRIFTIFAPTNTTINRLTPETRSFYSDQKNSSELESLLNSHIVEGNFDEKSLRQAIKRDDGKTKLKTLGGGNLIVAEFENKIVVMDEKGGRALVQKSDTPASNGQVFVIDGILNLP